MQHAQRELALQRMLLTCDEDTQASIRVIEKNGGVFESRCHDVMLCCPKRRHWIDAGGASAVHREKA